MGLSRNEIIFQIILPTILCVAGIAVTLVLQWRKRKRHKGEIKESVKEALRESGVGVSPPVSNEEFEKQIKSYEAKLSQKEFELITERLEKARLLFERGTERREAQNYEGAIKDLEEALKILPEGSEPSLFTHFNLGIALTEFPRGDRESNLKRAIESYKKILSLHTIEKTPERYASTQNNLGNTYNGLSEVRDKESNLGQAITAYNEALRVRTLDRFPQHYATTQNNLGNAYSRLSEVRDKEGNLARAIGCYTEALKVRTREAFPWYFVETSWNMAVTLYKKGDLAGASRVMEGMLPVAEGVGHPKMGLYRQFYEGLKGQGPGK